MHVERIQIRRGNTTNPKSPMCLMHLRRICGVCRHFDGPSMTQGGHCTLFDASTPGRAGAADCEEWERKTATLKPEKETTCDGKKANTG